MQYRNQELKLLFANTALPDGWYRVGSNLLKFFPERKTWEKARHSCQSIGGELVSINDEEENDFIFQLLNQTETNTMGKYSNS